MHSTANAPEAADHDSRVLASIAEAYSTIPVYKRLGRTLAGGASLAEALKSQPLLSKRELRTSLPKHWVAEGIDAKAELSSGRFEIRETRGTTGERARILWEKGAWEANRKQALLLNGAVHEARSASARAFREAVLSIPRNLASCHTGDSTFEERTEGATLYLNMRADPNFWSDADVIRMLDELERHETAGLEADPAYLALLASRAREAKRSLAIRKLVVSTHSLKTAAFERTIRDAFAGSIVDFYACAEAGPLFTSTENGYFAPYAATAHTELLPAIVETPGATGVAAVVVTTIGRTLQPLVRYFVGDLVGASSVASPSGIPMLKTLEGRMEDALVRPDGAIVTAGAIDRALAAASEIGIYQVQQRGLDTIEVDIVPRSESSTLASAAVELLRPLFGVMSIEARTVTAIAPEAGGKFRSSRRHVPLNIAKSFSGCEGIPS